MYQSNFKTTRKHPDLPTSITTQHICTMAKSAFNSTHPTTAKIWRCEKAYQVIPSNLYPSPRTRKTPMILCAARTAHGIDSISCQYEHIDPNTKKPNNTAMLNIHKPQDKLPLNQNNAPDDLPSPGYRALHNMITTGTELFPDRRCGGGTGLGEHIYRDCFLGAECASSSSVCGADGEQIYRDYTRRRWLVGLEVLRGRTSSKSARTEGVGTGPRWSARLAVKEEMFYGIYPKM